MAEEKILPADVYDTLELSAYAFGGIGAGAWNVGDNLHDLNADPLCKAGHADFCDPSHGMNQLLCNANVDIVANDEAVVAINRRKRRRYRNARVSWKEYTRELNIVRGD